MGSTLTHAERLARVASGLYLLTCVAWQLPVQCDAELTPMVACRLLQATRSIETDRQFAVLGLLRNCTTVLQAQDTVAWWSICESMELLSADLYATVREDVGNARRSIGRHAADRGYVFSFAAESHMSVELQVEWTRVRSEVRARFARSLREAPTVG